MFSVLIGSCSREGASTSANVPPPQSVRVIQATAAAVPLEIAAIGYVEAISTVDVKARITAPVMRVHFSEGEEVKAGQLLFELDAEPIRRQIAEIEANISRDVALGKQAEANIRRDLANSQHLDSVAKRSLELKKEGIFSSQHADEAVASADAAKASLAAGRAAVESAKAGENANRARLMEAKLQLDYARITAPISGRAGVINTKQGSLAKQYDNTLVTLLQTAPVQVSFSVPEDLLPQVRKYHSQKPMTVTAESADGHKSTGVLDFIDSSVDTTTGGIKMKARFANTDRVLWPGQFVNVQARLSLEADRVLISSQAVQTGPNGKFVWIYHPADSTVTLQDVQVLRLYTPKGKGEQAVIGSGLQAGDSVISEGQKRLTPKAKVRVLPPGGPAAD